MFFWAKRNFGKILLAGTLVCATVPAWTAGAAQPFEDATDSYALQEINLLAQSGIISGYEDHTFQPSKAMSRAELAKIIALSMGLKEKPEEAAAFQDVPADSWYRGYVGALVEAGIAQGTSDTSFSPDARVTREELVVFLIRGLGLEATANGLPAEASLTDFADVSGWAKPHVALGYRIGLIRGIDRGDGTLVFEPKQFAERQALARLAYEFVKNKEEYVSAAKTLAGDGRPTIPEIAKVDDELPEITGVSAVDSTTIEVTFAKDLVMVDTADFILDGGLSVIDAAMKSGNQNVAVLTTDSPMQGAICLVSYKGKNMGGSIPACVSVANAPGFSGVGGGGYGGSSGGNGEGDDEDNGDAVSVETVRQQLSSGSPQGTVTISDSGTYGSENGPDTQVKHLIVDPGPDGEVTLQHLVPEQLEVLSGNVNSIKLQQTVIKQLRVNAINNGGRDVRIEARDGVNVESTEVESQAVLESSSTTGKLGTIRLTSGAAGKSLTLKGNIDGDVTVEAPGSTVKLAPPSGGNKQPTVIKNLKVGSNSSIALSGGTSLSRISVTGSGTNVSLSGSGEVASVNVDSSASGTTLNIDSGTAVKSIQADSPVTLSGSPDAIAKIKTEGGSQVRLEDSIENQVKNKAVQSAVAAIDLLGSPDGYTSELDAKIEDAEQQVKIAKAFGATEAEIANFAKLTVVKATVDGWKSKVAKEKELLNVVYQAGDSSASVTEDVSLRTTSDLVGSIVWSSDKPQVIDATGKVTRPAVGQADELVTLTATLALNGYTESRTYAVTVKAEAVDVKGDAVKAAVASIDALGTPDTYSADLEAKLFLADQAVAVARTAGATDAEIANLAKLASVKTTVDGWKSKVAQEKSVLDVVYQAGDSASSVTKDLVLRTTSDLVGSIVWSSDKPQVIDAAGKVVRPAIGQADELVALTATLALNGYEESRTYTVTVKAEAVDVKGDAVKAAVAAIDALGAPDTYSAELETKIAAADKAVAAARAAGATDAEITNLANLTAVKAIVDGWKSKVAQEKALLDVVYQTGDSATSVTKDLTLRTTSVLVGSILWSSDKPQMIDSAGKVVRPAVGQADELVTLTATLALNGYAESRSYSVTVKAEAVDVKGDAVKAAIAAIDALGTPDMYSADLETKLSAADKAVAAARTAGATDAEIANIAKLASVKTTVDGWKSNVAQEKSLLDVVYQSGDSAASVTKDVTLRTTSGLVSSIAWSSDKPQVVDAAGKVVRPAVGQADELVTLTATLALNGYAESRSYSVTVKAEAFEVKGDAEKVAVAAIDALGTPDTYSADLETKLSTADKAVAAARAVGATDAEITNLAKLTALKATVDGWKNKVAQEKALLDVVYQTGDSASSVTKDVVLRTTSDLVGSIEWSSDKPLVIDAAGKVARPAVGQANELVTLTATLALNGYAESRSYSVTVKAQAVNHAPVGSKVSLISLIVGVEHEIAYSTLATDSDGDLLTATDVTYPSDTFTIEKKTGSLVIKALSGGSITKLQIITVRLIDGRGGAVDVSFIVSVAAIH
ncbi:MAG: hypothetical protein K0R75_444 [Paenibacillaceae bacterium]|nr:hypothetical protein [Paenibacillaceae bacterium]